MSDERSNVRPLNPTAAAILTLQEEVVGINRVVRKLLLLLKRNDVGVNAQLEALHRRLRDVEDRLC
jgi:hypothetical protein